MSDLLQVIGVPLSIILVASAILGASEWLEKAASSQVKSDLSLFIRTTSFSTAALRVPAKTQELFDSIFGKEHFSLKCVVRSALFSLCSLLVLYIIAVISSAEFTETLWYELSGAPYYRPFLVANMSWFFWSLVPDYFTLLKTRVVLRFLTEKKVGFVGLIVIVLIDSLISFTIFVIGFEYLTWISTYVYSGDANDVLEANLDYIISAILTGPIF